MNKAEELIQLFQNNFNCYADTEDESVVLAMDEDQFVKVALSLLQEQKEEKEDKAVDFYLWMNANNYDHNIRQRVEKKYDIFKRNEAI